MLNLDAVTDATSVDNEYDPMEAFYLRYVLPASSVEFFMESSFRFTEDFLTILSNESGLSCKIVWSIANNIRKPEYSESLKELIELNIDRLDLSNRKEILDDTFCEKVEQLIVRSKHNESVRKIADASYALVEQIFDDNGKTLRSYTSVKKCQIKKVVIYVLLVIMTVYLKHNQEQRFAA